MPWLEIPNAMAGSRPIFQASSTARSLLFVESRALWTLMKKPWFNLVVIVDHKNASIKDGSSGSASMPKSFDVEPDG
jgi:hypothetical protein